jgi:phage tail sheath gpL-like
MTTILQPKVTVNIVNASQAVTNTGQKILVVGQKVASGTAVAGALTQSIANGGAENALFGRTSQLAKLVRANKVRNQSIQIDAIALDDAGGGTAAAGAFVVTGTATEAGTFTIIVGSELNHSFSIAVASGTTATAVGDLIVTALGLDLDLPATIRGSIAGLSTSVTAMAGGATDPTLTALFDVVGDARYQAIVWPYPDSLSVLTAFLNPRFNADGKVLDGVGFTAKADTFSNLKVLGAAPNSQSLVVIGDKLESETNYKGPSIVEIPMVKAAQLAGFRSLRLDSSGVSIADLIITTNGPLDSFGGPALASKPFFNMPFADLLPIRVGRGFDDSEIEDLKSNGISLLGNNPAGNTVVAGEIVTTYLTDTAGNPDVTFGFLSYVDTASQAREYRYNNYRARFAQSRLTEGDIIKGRDMANELVIRSYSKRLYQDLSGVDYVLLESGEDALNFFNENLIISIDKALGKVTIQSTDPIVTQLRELAITSKIAFSIN